MDALEDGFFSVRPDFPSFNGTCDEFILSVTELVVDPMLSFVPKVTTVKVGSQNQKLWQNHSGIKLFLLQQKVAELVQKVSTFILPRVVEKLSFICNTLHGLPRKQLGNTVQSLAPFDGNNVFVLCSCPG